MSLRDCSSALLGRWPSLLDFSLSPRTAREDEPSGQCRRLVLRTPRTRNRPTERRDRAAELWFRLFEDGCRRRVQIAFAPDRAGQSTADCSILHDAAEQLTLERMDPNVFVADALRLNQAADDDASS
jgi:hypothetical protein